MAIRPDDPNRTTFHFQPPADWMNDPKLFFWEGRYHVFFQYSPGKDWHHRHWGHAVSSDLIHWEQLAIALTPTPGGPDKDGCFTGCVIHVEEDSVYPFRIVYTGVQPQVQCIAKSEDLVTWEKDPRSPVLGRAMEPEGFGPCWRDPCVWRGEDGTWYMIIGSQHGGLGAALLYRSPDLISWEYLHPLILEEHPTNGYEYECPDLFPLDDRYVLLYSGGERNDAWTQWRVGAFDGRRFMPERFGVADGGCSYAMKTMRVPVPGEADRRILWGWVVETRNDEEQRNAGWSGALSLPRDLRVSSDGRMLVSPVPELTTLRRREVHLDSRTVDEGAPSTLNLGGIDAAACEVLLRIRAGEAERFTLTLHSGGAMLAEIPCDLQRRRMGHAMFEYRRGDTVTLRVFIDHSVVEAFLNDEAAFTTRAYRADASPIELSLSCEDGAIELIEGTAWEMGTILPIPIRSAI